MGRAFVGIGALFGLVGVVAGAMGAHLSIDQPQAWAAATRYTMMHAPVLLIVGWARLAAAEPGSLRLGSGSAWALSGWLLAAGCGLFAGTIYLEQWSGVAWVGRLTPIGGGAMILGWLALLLAAVAGGGRRSG